MLGRKNNRAGASNIRIATTMRANAGAYAALSAAACVGLFGRAANAANGVDSWLQNSGTADWGTSANWSTSPFPNLATVDAKFDSTSYAFNPNIAAAYLAGDLVFGDGTTSTAPISINASAGTDTLKLSDDASSPYTIAVNTNKIPSTASAATMIDMFANAGAVTINANLVGNATAVFANNSVNLLTINGNLALNHSFVTAGTGNEIFNGIISGAYLIDTGGTGTVTLNGASTNTGGDAIEYGTTLIGISNSGTVNGALGPSTSAATLGYDGGSTGITAAASLFTNGAFTVSNAINIGQSTAAHNTTGTLTLGGNTASSSTYSGVITMYTGATLSQIPAGTVTFSNNITGAYPLAIAGGGTVAFTAATSYSGNTSIGGSSTLQLGGSGAIANSPTISIGAGSTFDVGPLGSYTLAANQTVSGAGTVLGNLTIPSNANISAGVSSSSNLGTLTVGTALNNGSLTLNSGSFFNGYLGTPGASNTSLGLSSMVAVNGNLTLSSGIKLNLADNAGAHTQGSAGLGYYELFSYTGNLNGFSPTDFNIVSLPASLTGDVARFSNQNNQIDVQFAAASAALTWTGAAANGSWDTTSTNWKNGSTPSMFANLDPVTFTDAGAGPISIQSGGVQPTGVVFNNNSSTYTFTSSDSNGISGSTAINLNGTGTVVLAGSNTFGGKVQVSAGTLVVANSSALGTSIGMTVSNGAALQLSGGIVTPSAIPLTVSGTGISSAGAIVNFSGNNTFAGAVTLAGNTAISSAAATTMTLGGGITNGGNTLTIGGAGNVTLANLGITGAGSLTYSGTGTLTLPTGSTYSGSTSIAGGTVNVADGTALGANGTTVNFTGNATLQAGGTANLSHPISISNGVTAAFDTNNNNMQIGSIGGSGAAGIMKLNSGTLSLTGNNTYAGTTVISGGTLQLNAPLSTTAVPVLHVDASTTLSGSTVINTGSQGGSFSGSPGYTALNGRQAFSFGAGSQFLQSANAYTNTGTTTSIFYVGTMTSAAAYITLSFIGPGGNQDYNNNGNFLIEGNPGTQISPYIGASGNGGDTVPIPALNTPLIFDTTINQTTGATGTTANLIINNSGTAAFNTGTGTAPAQALNTNQVAIGGRFNNGASESYNGAIGEVLIFNSIVSPADRAAVEQYLEAKWLGIGTSQGNLPTSTPVQIASGATLDLNGTSQQVPSISNYSGTGGSVTNSISAPATLVLAPTSGSSTFGGSINNGNGPVGVTFNGTATGVQILNGNNNYSGPTSINTGELVLGAGGSLGNTAITVASGATFGAKTGSGTLSIRGSLVLNNGSTLDMTDGTIGSVDINGSGTALKIGSALGGGATLKFDLSSAGTNEVVDSSAASVTGANIISITSLGSSLTNGATYPLITASSGLAGTFEFANSLSTESITVGSTLYTLALNNTATTESLSVFIPGITSSWNSSSSTAWTTAANWTPNTVPGTIGGTMNLDTVEFNLSTGTVSPVVPAGMNIQNVTFDTANVGALNVTGSTLTLSASGTIQTTSTVASNETISVPLVLEGNYSFLSNSAANTSLTLAGNVSGGASSATTLTLAGSSTGNNAISGAISDGAAAGNGGLSIVKGGAGTWYLTNSNNSFTGGTSLNLGVLNIVNGALGSGSIAFNGGTLQYAASGANQDLSSQINNSSAAVQIDTNGNAVTFSNSIGSSNTAGLTKLGAGSLTLSSSNSYQGNTLVSGGALNIANSSALPSGTTVTVASGAAMQLSGGVNVSTPLTLNGGGVTGSPAGALDSLSGSNTYSGNITLASSSTIESDTGSLNVTGNINGSGSTLTLAGATGGTVGGVINTGGLSVNGGTWAITGANTYSGVTTLNGGVTQISSAANLGAQPGSVALNSATLEVTATHTTPSAFSLGGASSTIQVDPGQTYTIGGSITNGASAGTLNKTGTGTLILNGSNSFSGGTNLTAGMLVAGTPTALGSSTVTLSGSSPTLQILPSSVGPTGFGFAAHAGWTLNQAVGDTGTAPSVSASNVLTLTTQTGQERRSAFYNTPVPYSNFTASFIYQTNNSGTNIGDGIAFVLQNSSSGATALGTANTEAYGGITNSAALAWFIYAPGNPNGIAQGSNGTLAPYTPPGISINGNTATGILYSGDPLQVTITGAASSSLLNLTLTDEATHGTYAGQTYSNSYALPGTLSSLIGGSTAYVGFTGATGGATSQQSISNFSYSNPFQGNFNAGNNVVVTTDSTIDVSYAGGAALGALTLGSNTLNITNASGNGATLSLTGANFTGSPVLSVAPAVQVNVGALNDNNIPTAVTINNSASNSVVNLTSAATNFSAGSSILVNGGELLISNGTAGSAAGLATVNISGGAVGGIGSLAGPLLVSSNSTMFVGPVNTSAGALYVGSGSKLLGSLSMNLTATNTSDEIIVGNGTGSVTLGGTLTVNNFAGFNINGGSVFHLFSFGSESGTFSSITEPTLPAGSGESWNNSALYTAGVISITGGGPASLTWDNAAGTGTWNTTDQNWNNGSGNVAYSDTSNASTGDLVTFNDANAGSYAVSISGSVHPTSVTFNNSAGNYTLSGANTSSGIAGSASLTKYGTGTVTLSSSNSYTGGTFVNAGKLVLANAAALPSNSSLNISAGATVQIANHSGGSAYEPVLSALSNAGTIDLTNNALVVHNGTFSNIYGEVSAAYHNGTWTGTGASGTITSSMAAADSNHLTALGVATNLSTFENQSVSSTDVLVKYTFYGDATLDGRVNSADYALIDAGYLSNGGLTGWQNGDFNYDGVINGSDYTLIDNAFNTQGAQILAEAANPTASIADQIAGAGSSAAVPEPTTLGLLGLGAMGLLGRRRRR